MKKFAIALGVFLATCGLAWGLQSIQIWNGTENVDATHGLPVNVVAGGSGGGPVTIASGGVASGAYASGSVASGAFASGSIADGAMVTLGAKADAKSTATDTTSITAMQVLKEISAMVQAPPSQAVTAISGGFADGSNVTIGAKADAKSTATDTTSITAMQVWKQISASVQSLVTQLSNPLPVNGTVVTNPSATTTGGATPYSLIATASTNSNLISAGAHTVYDIDVENNSSTMAYLKVYDKATAPTCNSDTPIKRMIVPGNAGGSGFMKHMPIGAAVTLGLGFCLTGGIADNDNTSVAATTYTINVDYK